MRRRRSAVLMASIILLSCLWALPAAAAAQDLYLRGDGEPKATMSTATPPSIPLPDYDGEASEGGRLVKKDGGGWNQADGTKYQQWSFDVSGQTISVLNFRIWAAAKDFDGDKDVRFRAYLLDCGGSCSLIQQSSVFTVSSSGWNQVTVPFNANNLSFGSGRTLVVKITVVNDSDDDMWFAYGTSTYNAHLKVNMDSQPPTTTTAPTTTTSTTTPSTTSTTQAAATTTTRPRTPATTAASSGPDTSAGETTTTTAGVDVVGAPGDDDGGDAETMGDPGSGGETGKRPTPVVFSPPTREAVAQIFETPADLQPVEGLMVAFATMAENIGLYWQAAVGLGSVAAALVWRGLASGREWEAGGEKPGATGHRVG